MAKDALTEAMRPSLDRLKRLDTLPNLESQLQEARRLCNHSARAEMISKWLLDKLKTNSEVRSTAEAWETLMSAFRLISPQRMAILISSHDFLGTCRGALEESTNLRSFDLFLVIENLLNFLIQVCNGPNGTQLQAVLSISAVQAAQFLGSWLRSILALIDTGFLEDNTDQDHLQPGIQIWHARKPSSDDDEIFATHCLASTSLLLPNVSSHKAVLKHKRRASSSGSLPQTYMQILESELARHVFIPARAAFFKAQDIPETKTKRHVGSQSPEFVIRSLLSVLRESPGLRGEDLAALPVLLDIATRCSPLITPKQRIREKIWLDAVFEGLLECSKDADDSASMIKAIEDMLSAIGQKHVALSKNILDRIIERYSGLEIGTNINWKLISHVLKIDSDVLSSDEKTVKIFDEISKATAYLDSAAVAEATKDLDSELTALHSSPIREPFDSQDDFADFLRGHIAAPLMKAFADQRKLESFVDIWATQIKDDKLERLPRVWADLEGDFARLLEESFTLSQVTSIFERYAAPIIATTGAPTENDSEPSQSDLSASIMILDAILCGTQSETIVDALHGRCGHLLKSMLGPQASEHHTRKFALPLVPQLWHLMTKAFELWFPIWAIGQPNVKAIAETGKMVVESSTFEFAELMLRDSDSEANNAANAFVVCVYSHFYKYHEAVVDSIDNKGLSRKIGLNKACLEPSKFTFDRVYNDGSACLLPLQYSRFFEDHEGHVAVGLVESSIQSRSVLAVEATQALTTSIIRRHDHQQLEDFVEMVLRHIISDDHHRFNETHVIAVVREQEIATLKAVSALSPESISRPQREKMINAISLRQQSEGVQFLGQEAQTWRLAALATLTKIPNATSVLSVDPEHIWRLAESIALSNTVETPLIFLEQLTIQLCRQLLATQDQERSQSMLIQFSERIKSYMDTALDSSQADNADKLPTVTRTLIVELENGAKESLKSRFVHRNTHTVQTFLDACLRSMSVSLQQGVLMELIRGPAFKILVAIPQPLVQLSSVEVGTELEPLMEAAIASLTSLEDVRNSDMDDSRALQSALVDCFQFICNVSTDAYSFNQAKSAFEIARLQLTPTQRDCFHTAFRLNVEQLEGQRYTDLLNSLVNSLQDGFDTTAATTLTLIEICAAKLDKAKLEDGNTLMPNLLSVLLEKADRTQSTIVRKRALACVAAVLKGSMSLLTQYCIDITLDAVQKLVDNALRARSIFLDLCKVLSIMLLQFRSRLHGRFHLVVPILQALVTRLFQPATSNRSVQSQGRHLTTKHAESVCKLLTLFCEPPQSKRSSTSSSLVDEARKEQAHVGKFAQYILHHYCSQILSGKSEPGVREAITPGLWSMIEAMQMGEAEGVKSLSAAMNNNERAVLRGVYDDWRRFGKWRGA